MPIPQHSRIPTRGGAPNTSSSVSSPRKEDKTTAIPAAQAPRIVPGVCISTLPEPPHQTPLLAKQESQTKPNAPAPVVYCVTPKQGEGDHPLGSTPNPVPAKNPENCAEEKTRRKWRKLPLLLPVPAERCPGPSELDDEARICEKNIDNTDDLVWPSSLTSGSSKHSEGQIENYAQSRHANEPPENQSQGIVKPRRMAEARKSCSAEVISADVRITCFDSDSKTWIALCGQQSVEQLDHSKVEEEVLYSSTSSHSLETVMDACKEKGTPALSHPQQQIMLDSQTTEMPGDSSTFADCDTIPASEDNDETDIDIIQTEFETDTENELANDEVEVVCNSYTPVETGIGETGAGLDINSSSVVDSLDSNFSTQLPPLLQLETSQESLRSLYKNPKIDQRQRTEVRATESTSGFDCDLKWSPEVSSASLLSEDKVSSTWFHQNLETQTKGTGPDNHLLNWNIPKEIILKRNGNSNVFSKLIVIHNPTFQSHAFKISFRAYPPSALIAEPCSGVLQSGDNAIIEISGRLTSSQQDSLCNEKILVEMFPIKPSQTCVAFNSPSWLKIPKIHVVQRTIDKVLFWKEGNDLKEKLHFFRSIENKAAREYLMLEACTDSKTSLTNLRAAVNSSRSSAAMHDIRICNEHLRATHSSMISTWGKEVAVVAIIAVVAGCLLYASFTKLPPPVPEEPQSLWNSILQWSGFD